MKARFASEQALRQSGRRVLGAVRLVRQHPWSEPRSPRQFDDSLNPTYKVGSDTELRVACGRETTRHRAEHRAAYVRRRSGERPVYPAGSYAAWAIHGADVEPEPPSDAVLAAPDRPTGRLPSRVRRKLRQELDAEARELPEEDQSLAERLEAGAADAIDRERVTHPDALLDPEEEPPPKRVVLRNATRAAKRRWAKRRRRERGSEPDAPAVDEHDPDPPPH